MNNLDFKKLLTTNDKGLVAELTRHPKKKGSDRAFWKGHGKGAAGVAGGDEPQAKAKRPKPVGKGAGKGAKDGEADADPLAKYRDRAKERREGKGEYEQVAQEFESHEKVAVDDSKYLGGDLEHTHLVKGLDFALLNKVRTELTRHQKAEELQKMRAQRKAPKKQAFETPLGRKVWNTLVETLHPHHKTFNQRLDKMHKAIAMGQHIRGAPSTFLPGRMRYEFDTALAPGANDIPRIVYMSKEEAPPVDFSKKAAPVLQDTVLRVGEALKKAAEARRLRKLEKASAPEAPYTVAQKVVPTKHRAQDLDNDIFADAGGFNAEEYARAAKASAKPADPAAKRQSYFDDDKERQRQPDAKAARSSEAAGRSRGAEKETFMQSDSFLGARPGWVFKLGPQGLGYYRDPVQAAAAAAAAASRAARKSPPAAAAPGLRRSLRTPAPRTGPLADEEDAYGECFPESGLGHARMATGEAGESDEEGEEKKKGLKKKGEEKGQTTVAANQKAEAKKRKKTETQEWQKIDHMIKKGKHGTIDELEAYASKQKRNQPPARRDVGLTPSFF